MEADAGKRRALIAGLAALGALGVGAGAWSLGAFQVIGDAFRYSASLKQPIDDPEYMYQQALDFQQQGNSVFAQAAARRALMDAPDYQPARKFLAATALRNHDFTDAAQYCRDVLSATPNDPSASIGLAQAYQGLGKTPQAEAEYRRVSDGAAYTDMVRQVAQQALNDMQGTRSAPSSTRP